MTERCSDIRENYKRITDKIFEAAISANRSPDSVKLMAVTKTNSAEKVNQAISAGVTLLGENRAQELLAKYNDYDCDACDIHFIGHLQSNKVKSIIDKVSMVQSVDRLSLLKELDRYSLEVGKIMPVLIEVNIGREESKSGVLPEQLEEFAASAAGFTNIKVCGLMTIPPISKNIAETERYFEQMYRRFIDIKGKKMDNISMDILSMGMSDDFQLAVKHGSNIVRIGRGLFGERL